MAMTSTGWRLPSAPTSRTSSSAKITASFLNIPAEAQREIVAHCSQSDLICLALVSRRCHELASAQLYRNFHIIFPDEDDINFDSPIDGLAGGLDTFTTSEHNYARYLKDISMDTLSSGRKGEQSYQLYLYKASCGKFLNTLLLLTLKRARSLESFRWNIRIELSRPVYAQLHENETLKKLHIRMQAGGSYYTPPPPLPASTALHQNSQTSQSVGHFSLTTQPAPSSSTNANSSSSSPPLGIPPALLPHSSKKLRPKSKGNRSVHPPTLSGFKNLSSLSVLDIDDLDIVEELQICVKKSFSTLKSLQLSLSCTLAQRARKSTHDSDADDSDSEDDLQDDPQSNNAIDYNGTGPEKAFRAQEERKLQELILARIFDIKEEPQLVEKSPLHLVVSSRSPKPDDNSNANPEPTTTGSESRADDPRVLFLESLKSATTRLMTSLNGSRDFSVSQREALEMIERAARKYVDSEPKPAEAKTDVDSTTAKEGQASTSNQLGEKVDDEAMPENEDDGCLVKEMPEGVSASRPSPISSDPVEKIPTERARFFPPRAKLQLSPEDIDIEHLETIQDHLDDFQDQQQQPADEAMACSPAGAAAATTTTTTTTATPLTQRQGLNQATTKLVTDCADHDDAVVGEMIMEEFSVNASSPHDDDDKNSGLGTVKVERDAITAKLVQLHRLVRGIGRRVLEIRHERSNRRRSILDSALDSELTVLNSSAVEASNEIRILEDEIEALGEIPMKRSRRDMDRDMDSSTRQSIEAYKRKTRGMSIESLKICLIPVKASVLSRAIDIACIRELSLINIGNQAPIWTMLAEEQKNRPLGLRSVYTDHVSAAFLACMAQLPVLDELFMLERGPKHRPESFAPRSVISMDQIRRLVLKKHMPTLKRLMIKDEYHCPTWDANDKTMILICTQGVQLEELALSMNIQAVHAFMQYFSGLVNLRAINILHFKNNDTCVWVMRELLRFIVDNLSHHAQLKLEWIATEDERVDRVIRPCGTSSEPSLSSLSSSQAPLKRSKDKGKGKAHVFSSPIAGNGNGNVASTQYPVLPTEVVDTDSDGDDGDDDDSDSGSRLRFKTIGPLQFYDVWGVKIFEKEIRMGTL
ncbi:hypothetical protein E4U21_005587 [Claviceps maximensis]|nr:hypothetical protein E4U21_005587 [Claviceps maximensis]